MNPATKEDIAEWFEAGKARGATHLIVVCDGFDQDDYPVYVMPGQDPRATAKNFDKEEGMQRVMEVYAMHLDMESQLTELRAMHFEQAHDDPEKKPELSPDGSGQRSGCSRGAMTRDTLLALIDRIEKAVETHPRLKAVPGQGARLEFDRLGWSAEVTVKTPKMRHPQKVNAFADTVEEATEKLISDLDMWGQILNEK